MSLGACEGHRVATRTRGNNTSREGASNQHTRVNRQRCSNCIGTRISIGQREFLTKYKLSLGICATKFGNRQRWRYISNDRGIVDRCHRNRARQGCRPKPLIIKDLHRHGTQLSAWSIASVAVSHSPQSRLETRQAHRSRIRNSGSSTAPKR